MLIVRWKEKHLHKNDGEIQMKYQEDFEVSIY